MNRVAISPSQHFSLVNFVPLASPYLCFGMTLVSLLGVITQPLVAQEVVGDELILEIEQMEKRLERLSEKLGEHEGNAKDENSEQPAQNNTGAKPVSLSDQEIAATARDPYQHKMAGLLKKSCFECHEAVSALGDLNLEQMAQVNPLVVNRKSWINVIEQLKNRSMPPADAQQPDEADRRYMTAWLTHQIENFDYTTVRQAGFEPAKRLTHDEYNNTIRDLFGSDLRPADKFPDDMVASSGFDNSANSLFIQPITMERYVGAAEDVATRVFADNMSRLRFLADATSTDQVPDLVKRFASRAFRRPLQADELTELVSYCSALQTSGSKLDSALQNTVQAILVSPSF
jgi:hypothetical protein